MLWLGSPYAVLPKERKLFVRCDGVLLGRDRNSSLASANPEKLLRGFPCDAVEDLNVSSDSFSLCPLCSPYVKGVEGVGRSAEGVPGGGFDDARNPSYSKKSSWAPAVGFSFLGFLSEEVAPLPLENIFLALTDLFCCYRILCLRPRNHVSIICINTDVALSLTLGATCKTVANDSGSPGQSK